MATTINADNVTGGAVVTGDSSGVLGLQTAGTTRMTIDGSGNVGIGTSSPLGLFHSSISGTANNSFFDAYGGSTNLVFRRANGSLASPTALLADDSIATFGARGYDGTSFTTLARSLIGINAAENWSNTAQGSYITFNNTPVGSTTRAEVMRINPSGNVGIGTSSPGVKLDVVHASGTGIVSSTTTATTVSDSAQIRCVNGTVTSQFYAYSNSSVGAVGTNSNHAFVLTTNNTERMRITSGGEVYIAGTTDQGAYNLQCNGTGVWGAGAYVNGSDARIKENVAPIASGLSVVEKLNPVTFNYLESWSSDRSTQTGFIAQELQAAMADEVYVDGIVQQGPEYMSVAYQALIPILTKAIQEQQQQIDALKAEVASLKGN